MQALVTGATGFIGQRLVSNLDHPVVLSRNTEKAKKIFGDKVTAFRWDPLSEAPPKEAFEGIDTVFHLIGEPVASGRWTEARKKMIIDSRIMSTQNLETTLEQLDEKPSVLVSASAVGYYGDRGDTLLDESADPGRGFLAELCKDWEDHAQRIARLGIRIVTPRIGVVLGTEGGALARMVPVFNLFMGGKVGSGKQFMPWIHSEDLVGILLHAARTKDLKGPINGVAPISVTNQEFTGALAARLNKPAFMTMPEVALKMILGEASSILLASQRIKPAVAEETGFSFRYPDIEAALNQIFPS